MKKTTIAIVLSTILLACGSSNTKSSAKFVPFKDTSRVIGMYIDLPDTLISVGVLGMVVDKKISVDSMLVSKPFLDTIYYKPKKGSIDLELTAFQSVCVDQNFDTCVARLSRWKKEYVKYLNKIKNEKDSLYFRTGGTGTVKPSTK